MAINAGANWEIRTTGNILNGTGYDSTIAGAGTDYSQQDTAQLTLTDLACANNTTLTSVTGGFTAAMIGNAWNLSSGTNLTPGFYFVTAVASSNSCTIDRNPCTGGSASAVHGSLGGARTTIETTLASTLIAGNHVWIKSGSYSWAALSILGIGTPSDMCTLEGYKTTRGDNPTLTDRPLITMSGQFSAGTGSFLKNLSFAGSFAGHLVLITAVSGYSLVINCKFVNTGAGVVAALYLGDFSAAYGCEAISTNGVAINGVRTTIIDCYVHGSNIGMIFEGARAAVLNCVYVGNTIGLQTNTNFGNAISRSVFYNNTTGINANNSLGLRMIGNIISNNATVGISIDSPASRTGYFDYNIWNNTTDFSGFTKKGPHDITGNPLLTNPGAGDFSVQVTSPAINAGPSLNAAVGLTGTYKYSIGVDQIGSSPPANQQAYVS